MAAWASTVLLCDFIPDPPKGLVKLRAPRMRMPCDDPRRASGSHHMPSGHTPGGCLHRIAQLNDLAPPHLSPPPGRPNGVAVAAERREGPRSVAEATSSLPRRCRQRWAPYLVRSATSCARFASSITQQVHREGWVTAAISFGPCIMTTSVVIASWKLPRASVVGMESLKSQRTPRRQRLTST